LTINIKELKTTHKLLKYVFKVTSRYPVQFVYKSNTRVSYHTIPNSTPLVSIWLDLIWCSWQ